MKIDKEQIERIAKKSEKLGDKLGKKYRKTNKLKCAKLAISAYRNVLRANTIKLNS
jgi:hypothetical protein